MMEQRSMVATLLGLSAGTFCWDFRLGLSAGTFVLMQSLLLRRASCSEALITCDFDGYCLGITVRALSEAIS